MEYTEKEPRKIGSTMRELRIKRGLTCEELGRLIGISASAINMYESGRRVPRDEIKVRFANYFGKSIEQLFFQKELHDK